MIGVQSQPREGKHDVGTTHLNYIQVVSHCINIVIFLKCITIAPHSGKADEIENVHWILIRSTTSAKK